MGLLMRVRPSAGCSGGRPGRGEPGMKMLRAFGFGALGGWVFIVWWLGTHHSVPWYVLSGTALSSLVTYLGFLCED